MKEGEIFGLLGPNGAGKTTFLNILAGTVIKNSGIVNVWGSDLDKNIKFDFIILKQNNIEINPIEDTMLISYTLDAGTNRHNLDTLSEIHLSHKTISYKELVGTGKNKLNFSDVALDKATEYNSKMCWFVI